MTPQQSEARLREVLPRVLPPEWARIDPAPMRGQLAFHGRTPDRPFGQAREIHVIASVGDDWGDGRSWLHVSLARQHTTPTYHDLKAVKELFIGRDRKAVMVLPEARFHVNIHPNVLHLFCCLSGDDGLPEFGREGTL